MKTTPLALLAKLLLSLAVSALILGGLGRLVFESSGKAMLPQLLALLTKIPWILIGTYAATAVVQGVLRAWRYRVLIAAGGEDAPPGLAHMTLVTMVRNMLVDVLPARLGEVSYIAMLNRGYRVGAGSCVSSLAVSVVFDLLSLLLFLSVLVAGQLLLQRLEMAILSVLLVLAVLSLALLAAVFMGVPAAIERLQRWTKPPAGSTTGRLMAFLDTVSRAVGNTRRAGVLGVTLLLSMGIRLVKYGALYLLFSSLAGAMPMDGGRLGPVSVLSGLISAEAAAGVPMPTFLGFGTYETGGMLALGLLGISQSDALLLFLGLHVITQSVDYLLGGVGVVLLVFLTPTWRRPASEAAPDANRTAPSRWWVAAALAAALGGIVFLGDQLRQTRKLGRLQAPSAGAPVTAAASRELPAAMGQLKGLVVWSSNRFGNHDILMTSLPSLQLQRLTRHPHTEYFPRVSPDGRRIAFARSQVPWVSQRNYIPWDIVVLDIETRRETVVAKNGNTPTWSEDGRRIFFQRSGNQFVVLELDTGREQVVYETGNAQLADSVMLETPVHNTVRHATAVTLRGSTRAVVTISDTGMVQYIGQGCQLNWGPRGAFLYQVDKGGRQENAIYRIDPASADGRTQWLDLPGEFSHEYFPKIGNRGRYMVLGASRGGHEHDSADYEIFLWRIGSDAGTAARLTYHTGNDCWPDLYLTAGAS